MSERISFLRKFLDASINWDEIELIHTGQDEFTLRNPTGSSQHATFEKFPKVFTAKENSLAKVSDFLSNLVDTQIREIKIAIDVGIHDPDVLDELQKSSYSNAVKLLVAQKSAFPAVSREIELVAETQDFKDRLDNEISTLKKIQLSKNLLLIEGDRFSAFTDIRISLDNIQETLNDLSEFCSGSLNDIIRTEIEADPQEISRCISDLANCTKQIYDAMERPLQNYKEHWKNFGKQSDGNRGRA